MTFKVVSLETHIPALALNGRLLAEWPVIDICHWVLAGGKFVLHPYPAFCTEATREAIQMSSSA